MKKIAIFGPYGYGNLGDMALVEATIQGVRRNFDDVNICGICQNPESAQRRHNINMYSIFRKYPKSTIPIKSNKKIAPGKSDHNKVNVSLTKLLKTNLKIIINSNIITAKIKDFIRPSLMQTKEKILDVLYLYKIHSVVKDIDLLIISGSGQLNEEWGGAWKYPFSLFTWCLIARLNKCKIAFTSVGAGTVKSLLARFFIKNSLKLAHYVSYRDNQTKAVAESLGIFFGSVVPDLAFSLEFKSVYREPNDSKKRVIGINPIAYCDPRSWFEKDPQKYQQYINKMSRFCNFLLSEDFIIKFIPNETRMDNWVIDDIVAAINLGNKDSSVIERPEIKNYKDIFLNLSACDVVIASRFHGLLFSALASKPTITISYHFKLSSLADNMGLKEYLLDISSFDFERLKLMFLNVVEHGDDISKKIEKSKVTYPALVESQFHDLKCLIS